MELELAGSNRRLAFINKLQDFTDKMMVILFQECSVTGLYRKTSSLIAKNSVIRQTNYTSQQDFGTRKVYCVSNVTFYAESKYAIKIFPSTTVFVQWPF